MKIHPTRPLALFTAITLMMSIHGWTAEESANSGQASANVEAGNKDDGKQGDRDDGQQNNKDDGQQRNKDDGQKGDNTDGATGASGSGSTKGSIPGSASVSGSSSLSH